MTAPQRRAELFARLTNCRTPLSAAVLAREMNVTRQVIVGDIALLRAEGRTIDATPRGYLIPSGTGLTRRVACIHRDADTRAELNTMVDCGCTVLDVIVEHPVYGQLTAPLQLSSRYDVQQFVQRMLYHEAAPLSLLTDGVHLHTLSCPSEEVFAHLREQLHGQGFLFET